MIANFLDSIPYVESDADRIARFPAPKKNFRVQYPDGSMKRFDGAAWNVFGATQQSLALISSNFQVTGDSVTDDRAKFDTLTNVTMQPNGGELDVVGIVRIASDLTIPANVRLNFRNGSYFSVDIGKTLTILGPFNRHVEKKFGGAGSFAFGTKKKMPYLCPEWFGSGSDGIVDDTVVINKTVSAATGRKVVFTNDHKITDEILPDNRTVIALVGGIIHQYGLSKNIFRVVQKDNVHFEFKGGSIYGEGTYSNAWVSDAGHEDRGIQMLGCTNCSIRKPRIRNCGLAGVVLKGGTNILIEKGVVEGTHALSTPLAPLNSYQFGYLIEHDPVYGVCDDIKLDSCSAFNVNFGINTVDLLLTSVGAITMLNCFFHDIIGQHGAYIGTSHTLILGLRCARCNLDGFKIFSGLANEIITATNIVGFDIWDCGGQAGEFGVSGTGYIYNCDVSGTARNCARAMTVDGDVRRCTIRIKGHLLTQFGLYVAQSLTANGPTDCIWEMDVFDVAQKGVFVNAPGSANNILRFKGRRCSTGGGGHWMIGIFACTSLTIESPDCQDDLGAMTYGIYVQGGTGIKITGTPIIKGYTTNGIWVDPPSIVQWLASVGEFSSTANAFKLSGNNIFPANKMRLGRQTNANANVPLWQMTLEDESVYQVTARISGKLAASAEAKVWTTTAMFRRDAAGVALLTGSDDDVIINTGAFAGTFAWSPTANDARLVVNSGSAVVYDWVMDVEVERLVG